MTEYWNISKVSRKTGKGAMKYIVPGGTAELTEAVMKRTKNIWMLYHN